MSLRIARTITVSLVSWLGFYERAQDFGGTATLVPPYLHTSLKLTYSSSGSEICQDQGSDLFVPPPQTQGKTVGWNTRSGSTKRSRKEHQSFQPLLLSTQPKSDSYCSSDPKLLEIKNCIVTIDAMGCQKEIAKTIQDQDAGYVFALKGNQGALHDDVTLYLDSAINKDSLDHTLDFHETTDAGHGRIEIRRYWICDSIEWLDQRKNWCGLKSIGVAESERHKIGRASCRERVLRLV